MHILRIYLTLLPVKQLFQSVIHSVIVSLPRSLIPFNSSFQMKLVLVLCICLFVSFSSNHVVMYSCSSFKTICTSLVLPSSSVTLHQLLCLWSLVGLTWDSVLFLFSLLIIITSSPSLVSFLPLKSIMDCISLCLDLQQVLLDSHVCLVIQCLTLLVIINTLLFINSSIMAIRHGIIFIASHVCLFVYYLSVVLKCTCVSVEINSWWV